MRDARSHFDPASVVVILLTLVLFATALFVKGLTHDLLLEAGVFLVSVKLIWMSYKQGVHAVRNDGRLARIEQSLERLLRANAPAGVDRPATGRSL